MSAYLCDVRRGRIRFSGPIPQRQLLKNKGSHDDSEGIFPYTNTGVSAFAYTPHFAVHFASTAFLLR